MPATVPTLQPGAGVNQFGQPINQFGQVPTGGFDQFGNPLALPNSGIAGFDQFGNPIGNGFTPLTNGFFPVSPNTAFNSFGTGFFPGFNPGFAVNPFGFGGVIQSGGLYSANLNQNAIPSYAPPSMATTVPTLGVTAPGAMRNPLRPYVQARTRGQRVRVVDGTVNSGRVIDGGQGTNLNYRTLMAHQSETAPAAGLGTGPGETRMARNRQDINERVAQAQDQETFIEGGGGMRRSSGTMIARNNGGSGIVERVAGSREEISSGSVMEVQAAPANAEQIRLARRAESIMADRPLVQGRVVRTGATGIEVTFDFDGAYRTEVFPIGQVFFFRDNGEMAAGDTDSSQVVIGSQVLVPLPASEPRSAVAGSRQENRTSNTYIFNGGNRRSTTVKSKVAGSRQSVRSRRLAK